MSKELANRLTGSTDCDLSNGMIMKKFLIVSVVSDIAILSTDRDLKNGMVMKTYLGVCGIALVTYILITLYRRYKQKEKSDHTEKSPIMFSEPALPVSHTENPISYTDNKNVRPVFNQVAARNAFMKNINRFTPKLHTLTDNTYSNKDIREDWYNEIIDINDHDLCELWKLIYKDEAAVKRIFAQWGLSPDQCTSFYAFKMHTDMYQTEDGASVKEGGSYNVMSPCWILTTHDKDSGKDVKSVILKGVVK